MAKKAKAKSKAKAKKAKRKAAKTAVRKAKRPVAKKAKKKKAKKAKAAKAATKVKAAAKKVKKAKKAAAKPAAPKKKKAAKPQRPDLPDVVKHDLDQKLETTALPVDAPAPKEVMDGLPKTVTFEAPAVAGVSKSVAVIDCVNEYMDGIPGWNNGLNGDDQALSDLHVDAALFVDHVRHCLEGKGYTFDENKVVPKVIGGSVAKAKQEIDLAAKPVKP